MLCYITWNASVHAHLLPCRYMLQDNAWYMPVAMAAFSMFMKTPLQGAQTSLHLITAGSAGAVSGKYWSDSK